MCVFIVRSERFHSLPVPELPCARWPYAGRELTPPLREAMGVPTDLQPERIVMEHPHQDYRVVVCDTPQQAQRPHQPTQRAFLVPYYATQRPLDSREHRIGDSYRPGRSQRNEELIVDRARSFINNAQPEIGAPWTKEGIDKAIGLLIQMEESTHEQCAQKAAQFRMVIGAVMVRLETLGRVITQGNANGTRLEYQVLDQQTLIKEFKNYYQWLTSESLLPLWRCVLLQDKKGDHNGILIDLAREIGKPLQATNETREDFIRDHIVKKIGACIESIQQTQQHLHRFLYNSSVKSLFSQSVQGFIREKGGLYGISNADNILQAIDHYGVLCQGRACIRSDDYNAYGEVFTSKSVLNDFFFGSQGLLEHMREAGHDTTPEASQLRRIISRTLRTMERAANTRIPCNYNAPEIFIPKSAADPSITPMERYSNHVVMSKNEMQHAEEIHRRANRIHNASDREFYLRQHFCSTGLLSASMEHFETSIKEKNKTRSMG